MSSKLLPFIVGGLIPAVLYGITGIFQKLSAKGGSSAAVYLICFGASTVVMGLLLHLWLREPAGTPGGIGFAFLAGAIFALGAGLISIALLKFQTPIAQLSPLYNTNVLITVLLGVWLLAEGQGLHLGRLLGGTVLLMIGAVLVANA
ncbi:MAG: hypothetical protein AB1801_24990 [Chloroflexota bacterium]